MTDHGRCDGAWPVRRGDNGVVLQVTTRPHRPPPGGAVTRADRSLAVWWLASRLVQELTGIETPPSPARRCRTCGGTGHGKPELPSALAAGLHVSVSSAPGLLAVALSDEGPVGVDVESVGAVAAAPVADVLLHPREPAPAAPGHLARTWVRKEAVLKATGHGLVVAPSELAVSGPDERPALLLAPPRLGVEPLRRMRLLDLDLDVDLEGSGPDHVGAVAVLTP